MLSGLMEVADYNDVAGILSASDFDSRCHLATNAMRGCGQGSE
jgi:hypothetical protein